MSKKIACLSGFTGQDAPYLAKLLLEKDYKVYGLVRRSSHPNDDFISDMGLDDVITCEWDLLDTNSIHEIIAGIKPDEFYNLAAMSHVGTSFHQPEYTAEATALGVLRILEEIRKHSPTTKFYSAGSSEQFGNTSIIPQNENTPFMPRSPYAAAKVFAYNLVKVYRESYGLFACNGILQNHDSNRRGSKFLTKKVTDYIGKRKNGLIHIPLTVGCLDARRDFGYAPDFVRAMYLMLQQPIADDYSVGTGEHHSVQEFITEAFTYAGFSPVWMGSGVDAYMQDLTTKEILVTIDPKLYRPAEVPILCGDYSKAKRVLGWEPSVYFNELVKIMVDYDIKRYQVKNNYVHSAN